MDSAQKGLSIAYYRHQNQMAILTMKSDKLLISFIFPYISKVCVDIVIKLYLHIKLNLYIF